MSTEIKNMAYWKAKNTLPGVNPNSEGNTDTPDGKSGSSPLQSDDGGKAVKISSVSVEDQIAAANKKFGGKGVTVAPKTKTDPTGSGKQPVGVDALANKAMHNMMSGGGYGKTKTWSYTQLPFNEKQELRNKAFEYQKKMNKRKQTTKNTP